MTEKVARTSVRRRNSTSTMSRSSSSTHSAGVSPMTNGTSVSDESDLSPIEISSLKLSIPFPWAKSVPESSVPSPEDQAVSQFFEKFVMYPCNSGSSPGFLEHLPSLFKEVKTEGRMALRWAVRAASYASLSSEQNNAALRAKALSCYGQALSALGESLADPNTAPDDFTLMTVVVLDLFEVCGHPPIMARLSDLTPRVSIYKSKAQEARTLKGWRKSFVSVDRIKFMDHEDGVYSAFHIIVCNGNN